MRRWLKARRSKPSLADRFYAVLAQREFEARLASYELDNYLSNSEDK